MSAYMFNVMCIFSVVCLMITFSAHPYCVINCMGKPAQDLLFSITYDISIKTNTIKTVREPTFIDVFIHSLARVVAARCKTQGSHP